MGHLEFIAFGVSWNNFRSGYLYLGLPRGQHSVKFAYLSISRFVSTQHSRNVSATVIQCQCDIISKAWPLTAQLDVDNRAAWMFIFSLSAFQLLIYNSYDIQLGGLLL